jgi:hypothetical protein
MAFDGECITELFYLIADDPTPATSTLPIPNPRTKDCCDDFLLKVFGDINDADSFKNDVSGFLYVFKDVITTATLKLQKKTSCDYTDVVTLTNNDYGINYALGFYVNDNNENYRGYQLYWRNVLIFHGPGEYRILVEYTSSVGGSATIASANYKLMPFSANRVNQTVKIEYWRNGQMGLSDNDKRTIDYATLNWYNSIRIPGFFGDIKSDYTDEKVIYENGQRLWVKDEQEPELTLSTKALPGFVHEFIRTDVLQADEIAITDYNSNNPNTYIQKLVHRSSSYAPDWHRGTRLASVKVNFKQAYNNLKKRRC